MNLSRQYVKWKKGPCSSTTLPSLSRLKFFWSGSNLRILKCLEYSTWNTRFSPTWQLFKFFNITFEISAFDKFDSPFTSKALVPTCSSTDCHDFCLIEGKEERRLPVKVSLYPTDPDCVPPCVKSLQPDLLDLGQEPHDRGHRSVVLVESFTLPLPLFRLRFYQLAFYL